MVSNVRDRSIDSARREDSRKGQVDRCEVVNVRPHVAPYPDDKDFNTVDVQLIDRPRINGKPLHIKYVKLNSLQRYHGRFQGEPWNPRIGDMIYVYWLAEREALVLGLCTSVEQEPVCRSQADAHHQEHVFKLCPWEEPKTNEDKNYVEFPDPKHPECYKWWPKTRDSLWIFDCLEGHNTPSCCAQACNSLDDHLSSTCFKNFSDISPTTIDKQKRFKFLHRCGSFWYYDNDGTIHIAGKVSGDLKNQEIFYPSGKILLENVVDSCSAILDDDGDIKLNPLKTVYIDGDLNISGACTHGSCSCEGEYAALDGAAGGQAICGGTEAGDDLELQSTSNATKGCIKLNCGSANVDPSLTYDADCPCFIETAGLQLAMGCAVNTPYAFWMQVRQSTNVSWGMHLQPLGGDIQIGNASGGSKLGINISPAYNLDVLANMRISGDTWPGYFLQSNQAGSKLWCLMAGSGNVFIRNSTDETNPFIVFNSGGVLIGPAGGDPGTNNLQIMGKTIIGEDPYTATNGLAGWGFQRYTDGSLYTAWKTVSGGSINLRCGAGAETGYARTFLTITPSTGACYFLDNVSALSFTDRTPGYSGDALADLKNVVNDAQGRISHKTLPAFARAKFTDPETGTETEGRNIGNMVSILIKAVQQLTEKLEAAEKKIAELETKV